MQVFKSVLFLNNPKSLLEPFKASDYIRENYRLNPHWIVSAAKIYPVIENLIKTKEELIIKDEEETKKKIEEDAKFFKSLIPQPQPQPQPNVQKRLTLAEKMALDAQRDENIQ
jgi:hypothetical protein